MAGNYPNDKIDYDQIHTRLTAIYARVMEVREERAKHNPGNVIKGSDLDRKKVLRSRLQSVEDAESGLSYAVWAMGEVLCSIGGTELMHQVMHRFEDEHGGKGAVWLDHRWNDVQARGDIWLA